LGPGANAEKVYALFLRALADSGLVGVAKFVLRERQHLGALRVLGDVVALEQLHFADEIAETGEVADAKERVSKDDLAMARRLIEANTTSWKPERYRDTYRDELEAAIEAKRKGRDVHAAAEIEEFPQDDLLAALRESVARSREGGRDRSGLDGLTKGEL